MSDYKFQRLIRSEKEKIEQVIDDTMNFEHHGRRGHVRAEGIANFLKNKLPGVFGVSTHAETIDYTSQSTGELDIVIYDSQRSNLVLDDQEAAILPAESLFSYIEVKSELTREEIKKTFEKAGEIHKLKPYEERFTTHGEKGDSGDVSLPRCMVNLVAFETDLSSDNWIRKEYNRAKEVSSEMGYDFDLIDRIFVLGQGGFLPSECVGRAGIDEDKKDIFIDFYVHLTQFLQREYDRRPPMNWHDYIGGFRENWGPIN